MIFFRSTYIYLLYCLVIVTTISCATNNRKIVKNKKNYSPQIQTEEEKNIKIDAIMASESLIRENFNSLKQSKNHPLLLNELFLKAVDASLNGNHNLAAFFYKLIVEFDEEDMFIRKQYAIELVRIGKLEQSKKVLEILVTKTDEVNIKLLLAGVYIAVNETKSARLIYEGILKKDKQNEDACLFLAKSYTDDKLYKRSIKLIARCEKGNPKGIFSFYKGKIYLELNKMNLSVKYFKKALKIDPQYYQAAVALGLLKEEKENYIGASQIYIKYLKKDPDNYIVLSRLVQIYFAEGKFAEVVPYVERLVVIDTTDLNLKVRLGILYTEVKRYDDAKIIFWEILQEAPNSEKVLYYLASLHQQTDEYEKAIDYFSQVPASSSLFHDSNIQIGRMLHVGALNGFIKKETDGVGRFLSFIEEKSKQADLKFDLGIMLVGFYEEIKKLDDAIKTLITLKESKDFDEDFEYYLASLYEKNRMSKNATMVMMDIVKKNPKHADALNFIGYSILESSDNYEIAYDYIMRAYKLKPLNGYILDSLGWYYFKVGKLNKAIETFIKALKNVNNDSTIYTHMGIIYKKLGEHKKAQQFFKEALVNCEEKLEKIKIIGLIKISKEEELRVPASKKP